ncbi:probable cytochrome P450 6a20 [Monomorium pharaonis]|uniref:probable cytochrome P450 6a20 n=1 Tax=Monomorium pharaonis TaxID=307658 RepID=UPI0017474B02|nr:probable cytochrome P450 6a20 [Monomorium pharaonis]
MKLCKVTRELAGTRIHVLGSSFLVLIFTMVLAELIGIFITALTIIYIYYKYMIFNFWHKKDVFYVKPVIPIGNISPLITGKVQIGVFFHDVYMKYKDHRAFGMYVLFKPILVIADLDLIRTVLTKEFKSFHDRGMYSNENIDPLSANVFLLPGKKWRSLRAKMTPTFTTGKIKQMFSLLVECSEKLSKNLESKAQMRESVEIKNMLARYSIDVIMLTAFGIKSNCIQDPYDEYFVQGKQIFKLNPIWIALAMFMPKIMDFFSIPLTDKCISNFYINTFREIVKYRQTHNIIKHDFMNLLIQLMEKGYIDNDKIINMSETTKITMLEAAAQSYVFIAAGFESSSTTATFALYELAQHQDIQDKVRKEIDEILEKHNDLSYDAMNEMKYLHKIINETMRKYPPLPLINRICTEELDLPTTNIHVPKETLIIVPVFGLHRDPAIYPDPDKFDPERFNEDEVAKRHSYAYLPFGEGPRKCIGERFGYAQVKVVLIGLLAKYKFKLHSRTTVPLIFNERSAGLTVRGHVHLIIEPR